MSENDISIWFHFYGIDEEREELEILDRMRDRVVRAWKEDQEEIVHGMRDIDRTVNISVSMVRNLLQMVGATLDPMTNAMMQTIQVTVQSLYRIAAAWGTTGYGLTLTVAIGAAAIGLSVWSASEVSRGMNEAKNQIQGAIGLTQNFQSLLTGLGRG